MSGILEALRSNDPKERAQACRDAASDPSAVLWVDALVQALSAPEREVRVAARAALAAVGREHTEVTVRLREHLSGEDRPLRWESALILGRLSPPELRFLPALVDALESSEGDVRFAAARLLVETGRMHGEVRIVLLQLLAQGTTRGKEMAIHALRSLAPGDPAVAAALLNTSRAETGPVRHAALAGLGALRVVSPEILSRLSSALESASDPAGRRLAAAALGQLGQVGSLSEEAIAALQRAKDQEKDPQLAGIAAQSLPRDERDRLRDERDRREPGS